MSIIIKSAGQYLSIEPENGENFTLKELQDIVGGYIEIVQLKDGYVAICDEEGKLKNKEVNPLATLVAHSLGWSNGNDCFCGDILVCSANMIQ